MMKLFILPLLLLMMVQPAVGFALSQAPPIEEPEAEAAELSFGPKRQIATIVYCGLGGAVLGLSTLSFYGRPQDFLSNIAVGFGVGVVIGTVYMTWNAATNPDDFYGATLHREQTRDQNFFAEMASNTPWQFSHTWTF